MRTEKKREKAKQEGIMGIESIVVTTEQDRVNREYPDYIDRQQIYTLWLQTSQPNEKFEDNINCANAKKQYLRLIDFIQTQTYKSSIVPSAPSTDSEYSTTQQSQKNTPVVISLPVGLERELQHKRPRRKPLRKMQSRQITTLTLLCFK